ncbi:MAG: hypothetical protein EPO31_01435 [Gammaproteobacteria bacterium]|nr:MAG: hypothetical protein EPO31_01435 [Gammaproteobacteria bacterium]
MSGEWAGEFGTGRNPYYVTTPGQRLSEQGWHAELAWRPENARFQPFAEIGYVYYSEDFTPFAQGFSDWGKWYLGNQIDWILFGTNSRIARAEAGFWPHAQVKLRLQYFQTRLVSGPGGPLANEWSLIADWYPSERVWCSALLGYSDPGGALVRSGLTNPFGYLNAGAVTMGGETSVDLVFAAGLSY